MTEFILELILFLSLGTAIYTLARAVPRLEEGSLASPKFVRAWLHNLPVHKFDAALSAFLEKYLRRVRVLILRIDNGLTSFMSRLRANSGGAGGTQKGLFSEKTATNDSAVVSGETTVE